MTDDSNSEPNEKPAKAKLGRKKGQKDDPRIKRDRKIAKVIDLASKKVEPTDIANAVDLPINTVKRTIAKFAHIFTKLEDVADYRDGKADLLAAAQVVALESALTGNKLQKASFLSTLQGFEILNKAERLDLGKSTENHAHQVFGRLVVNNEMDSDWTEGK